MEKLDSAAGEIELGRAGGEQMRLRAAAAERRRKNRVSTPVHRGAGRLEYARRTARRRGAFGVAGPPKPARWPLKVCIKASAGATLAARRGTQRQVKTTGYSTHGSFQAEVSPRHGSFRRPSGAGGFALPANP